MRNFILTILILLSTFAVAYQRKARPKPKPKPTPIKPAPNLPTPKNLGNCNSAQFFAHCAVAGPICVTGHANEGCLQESDQCTNCYRASLTIQPKLKPRAKADPWRGALIGKFTAEGFVVDNPGLWKRRGLRVGDIITQVDGKPITPDLMPTLNKTKRFRVKRQLEMAAK